MRRVVTEIDLETWDQIVPEGANLLCYEQGWGDDSVGNPVYHPSDIGTEDYYLWNIENPVFCLERFVED